jgi:hypothetical protein
MTDESRRGERAGRITEASAPGRPDGGPIGEAEADDFAADVVGAADEETGAPDPDAPMAGSAGGGTGVGDLAGGTGIGTDDAGRDAGGGR